MKTLKTLLVIVFLFSLVPADGVAAQEIVLPKPGEWIQTSSPYNPLKLQGLKLNKQDPLKFEFILSGNQENSAPIEVQGAELSNYFLAALTIPSHDMWVNLSPYEQDSITDPRFGQTQTGYVLLAQDYVLKQMTASLLHPKSPSGQQYWEVINKNKRSISDNYSEYSDGFYKVWIVPDAIEIKESFDSSKALISKSTLKVLFEEDYKAARKATGDKILEPRFSQASVLQRNAFKEHILPVLTKEVNEGAHFAPLRQIYQSLILATWYKRKIKQGQLYNDYVNQKKIEGLLQESGASVEDIFAIYKRAYKQKVFSFIREELDPVTGVVRPMKLAAGGTSFSSIDAKMHVTNLDILDRQVVLDKAMLMTVSLGQITKHELFSNGQWTFDQIKKASGISVQVREKLDGGKLGRIGIIKGFPLIATVSRKPIDGVVLKFPGNEIVVSEEVFNSAYEIVGIKQRRKGVKVNVWKAPSGSLGEQIEKLIRARQLTQASVARGIGVKRVSLSQYIRMHRLISEEKLERFIKYRPIKIDVSTAKKLRALRLKGYKKLLSKALNISKHKGTLGFALARMRIEKGFNQRQMADLLAKKIGKDYISKEVIGAYELNIDIPSESRLSVLIEILAKENESAVVTRRLVKLRVLAIKERSAKTRSNNTQDQSMLGDSFLELPERNDIKMLRLLRLNRLLVESKEIGEKGFVVGFPTIKDSDGGQVDGVLLKMRGGLKAIPFKEFHQNYEMIDLRLRPYVKWTKKRYDEDKVGGLMQRIIKSRQVPQGRVAQYMRISAPRLSAYLSSRVLIKLSLLRRFLNMTDLKISQIEKDQLIKQWELQKEKQIAKDIMNIEKGTLGYRLMLLRRGLEMSESDVANKLALLEISIPIHHATISSYEHNRRRISNERLRHIAKIYGVSFDELRKLKQKTKIVREFRRARKADQSMVVKGGIDLNLNNDESIKVLYQSSLGYKPSIVKVEPLNNLKEFFN